MELSLFLYSSVFPFYSILPLKKWILLLLRYTTSLDLQNVIIISVL